jgi:hypothetical protein
VSTIITNIFITLSPAPAKPLVTITLDAFRRGYEAAQHSTEPPQERMTDVELLEHLAMLVQGGTPEDIAYGMGNIVRALEDGQNGQ